MIYLVVVYFLNFLFSAIVILQKRNLEAKISWLFFFTIAPIFSHFYFLIYSKKYQKIIKYKDYLNLQKKFFLVSKNTKKNSPLLLGHNLNLTAIYKAKLILYDSGIAYYEDLITKLKSAKKNIFIVIYIIKKSLLWAELQKVLAEKAEQNVQIKLIIDHFGILSLSKKSLNFFRQKNIAIHVVEKISFWKFYSKLNFRNHSKIFIIDNQFCFTGGYNISDEYISFSKKYGNWIDVGIQVKGEYVNAFISYFLRFWYIEKKQFLDPKKYLNFNDPKKYCQNNVKLIDDGPFLSENILEQNLISYVYNAKKEIIISTPYFVITENIKKALMFALIKDVKVTLYLSEKHQTKNLRNLSILSVLELLDYGLKVYVYKSGFIHSKAIVFDRKVAYLGTFNLDFRSFFSQFEIANFFTGKAVDDLLKILQSYQFYSHDFASSSLAKVKFGLVKKIYLKIIKPVF